jgi:hypothetical protein
MDDISDLIPFSQLRQLRARDVSSRIDQSPSSNNLLIYEGLVDINAFYYRYIMKHKYFPLNQRYIAKLNHKFRTRDAFYEFTVFDLWGEKEM